MRKINKSPISILLLFGLLVAGGCKSKQLVQEATPIRSKSNIVLEKALRVQPHFQTAQAERMTVSLDINGRKTSVNAALQLISDSAMHLSIMPLFGVELFKAELSKTETTVIDKMNRRYVRAQLSDMAQMTGLTIGYSDLEAIVCGRLFALGNSLPDGNNMKLTHAEKAYTLSFEEQGIEHSFTIDAHDYKLLNTSLRMSSTGEGINIIYDNYQFENGVKFPYRIEMQFHSEKFSTNCVFEVLRARFNEEIKLRDTDLKRFKEISINEFLNK